MNDKPVKKKVRAKVAGSSSGDDFAYIAPMGVFLAITQVGVWWPGLFPISYLAKTILTALLLIALRRRYTRIKWNHWWLGILVGIVGIFQWVPMQLWLQNHVHFVSWFQPAKDPFDPTKAFASVRTMWAFIAVRVIGAVMVVPFMEELFWRDYLWRMILAPNNFKLAKVGEWSWTPFLIVAGAFATVHGGWWLTAIVWALMVGALLLYTKSLGACILAHATTNLLLAIYVLHRHDWAFW